MCVIKLKIDGEMFKTVLRDEMSQTIKYCGQSYPIFEFILMKQVGRIEWYKDWEEIDGFYYSEVKFGSSMVLDKIKKLTRDSEIMRGCRVSIYMTTSDKYGYYQVDNGFTDVGFSIKSEKFYYDKLVSDVKNIDTLGDKFKINLKEMMKIGIYRFNKDVTGRNVYSFFVNSDRYQENLLTNSIDRLGIDVFSV